MKFVNLHCHSFFFFSTLDGLSSPDDICKTASKYGYESAAITDHGSISACASFQKAAKKYKIKPILGNELYISLDCKDKSKENRKLTHLCVLAKNFKGWKQLIKINSEANKEEHYYYKPRIDLKTLANYLDGNIIGFSGHLGSDMSMVWFTDIKGAYNAKTIEEARTFLDPYGHDKARMMATLYREIFGPENFFLEIQRIDAVRLPAAELVSQLLRALSVEMGIPKLATADSHYPNREDAEDQQILLCSSFNTNFQKVNLAIAKGEDVTLGGFFKSNNYHIPSPEEMAALHTEDEIANAALIADMCENYSILSPPNLPKFPGCTNPNKFLNSLCEEGWRRKIEGRIDKSRTQEYRDRVKKELDVFTSVNLSDYFLIMQDCVNHFKNKGMIIGAGRGSVGGSLVAYLLNITEVDPVENGLIFERFYNAGRNSPGKVSLPDIDTDFPKRSRKDVIQYLKDKFGADKVAHVATFGKVKGRGAIKEVLRAHGDVTFEEMNRITEHIPDESKITDELQLIKDAIELDPSRKGEEPSIIGWTLENRSKQLEEWCRLKDDGTLEGPLAHRFAQAIRLEGTVKSVGKHASAIIISDSVLAETCPMIHSKGDSGELMVGVEHTDAEAMGLVKLDILGLSLLDKLEDAREMIQNGATI